MASSRSENHTPGADRARVRVFNAAAAVVLLSVAAAAYIISLGFPQPLAGGLGPGVFPRVAATALGLLALMYALVSLAATRSMVETTALHEGQLNRQTLFLAAATAAYISLMLQLGFLVASVLFLWGAILALRRGGGLLRAGLIALGTTLAVWLVFYRMLGVDLPSIGSDGLLARIGWLWWLWS